MEHLRLLSHKQLLKYIQATCILLPALALANHHGTRCHHDVTDISTTVLKKLADTQQCTSVANLDVAKAGQKSLIRIKKLGSHRKHYQSVPAEGAAYSMPYSFDTCQITLPKNACCPAIKWCYPLKRNPDSLSCGQVGKALGCSKEKDYCKAYPKAVECIKPQDIFNKEVGHSKL